MFTKGIYVTLAEAQKAKESNTEIKKSKTMITIDIKRIKDTLPKHGTVEIKWKYTPNGKTPYLECKIENPSLCNMHPMTYEQDFEQIKQWQREIIGSENISEFYTETTGGHWLVYLKRQPIQFDI